MVGYTAYVQRRLFRNNWEPDHLVCPTCYEQARRLPLQHVNVVSPAMRGERPYARFRCQSCKTTIAVDIENPIIPAHAKFLEQAPEPPPDLEDIGRQLNDG